MHIFLYEKYRSYLFEYAVHCETEKNCYIVTELDFIFAQTSQIKCSVN